MRKALFIRLDRMGDLVLTLPCDQLVTGEFDCHWVTPKGLDFVVESSADPKKFVTLDKSKAWTSFWTFRKHVKKVAPQVSVSFHVPWWVNFALWSCGVKVRGGVLSQWHSYLFLNKGLRQKRSRVEAHEMEYNFQLVEFIFNLKRNREKWQPLKLTANATIDLAFDTNQSYFVVHPGMGGSALNWPTQSYTQLVNQLTEKAMVVITGTKSDDPYLSPLKSSLKDNHKVVWLDKQLDGYQLLKLLSHANATIAPSTGVLHLSASLGAASFGIYSPIKVHQAERWGPKGNKTETFTPKVNCPAHFECLKQECPQFYCMDHLPIQPVVDAALKELPQ